MTRASTMELRKFGKSRISASVSPEVGTLKLFWQSFVIIASLADAVGLGKVVNLLVKAVSLGVLLPLTAMLIVLGNFYEKILARWGISLVTSTSTRDDHGWLSTAVISSYKSEDEIMSQLSSITTSDDNSNSIKEDAAQHAKVERTMKPEFLPRQLSELASQEPTELQTKVFKLADGKAGAFNPTNYLIVFKADSPVLFWKVIRTFFSFRPDEEDQVILSESSLSALTFLVNYVRAIAVCLIAFREVAVRLLEKRHRSILFKRKPCPDAPRSVAWADIISRDLLFTIEEKSASTREEIAMSCIVAGLCSYVQTMTGTIPDDVTTMVLNSSPSEIRGARLLIPLQSGHDTLITLTKTRTRLCKTKELIKKDSCMWNLFKDTLPEFLLEFFKRTYYGRVPIVFSNFQVNEYESTMNTTMVKSLHYWTPLVYGSLVSFTTMYTTSGVSVAILSDKNAIQSTTLLAECISKAVLNLCISLDIKWDRRSPPSTPTST